MDSNITNITVDLATTNNFGIVKAVQGDMSTRFIYITLLDNQVEYDFTDVYPVLRGTKPDGTTIFNECTVSEENKIIVELTEQILAEPGMSTYEIALYAVPADLTEEKRVITSFPFTLFVNKAAFDPKAVTSTDEFTAIADVIGNNAFLQGCLDDIAASRDAAKVSENNARTSEINAKNSETAAKNSEIAAKASEDNAKTSETNAKVSETAAKTSETNAKDSENKAKTSETNAKDSETKAKTSEDNAKASETNAKDSETKSKTSETNAKDSENKAKASETAAKGSEIAAENSYMLSKSYAVGTDNVTRPNDATDNSKYYSEQSKAQAIASATSAAAAAASEHTATQKATESSDSAILSRSWAVGDTDARLDETTDNAKYYSEQSKAYADSWKGSLLPKGTIPFSQLPTSDNVAGHMYNIPDAFETDSRFKDGAGYAYPAGTNVYWTVDGKWDCLSGVLTMELTMAEYNALPETQKMNGTIYYISDADNSIQAATENYDGLMSHTDKAKLDGMEDGATRILVDDTLSTTSENAVQNKAITNALNTNITAHNTSPDAHTDIRNLLSALTARLNALADSDDATLDQLSEIVAYIKANRSLIENITADGVSVLDIVDNLTSTATGKALSANQGKVLSDLISSLTESVNGIKEVNASITDSQNGIYAQATGYTDQKIADLINGAPSTLDTLGEIAQAMQENNDVVDALEQAIGSKASQTELDEHTGNDTIHITAAERQAWNDKQTNTGDSQNNIVTFNSGDSTDSTAWTNVPVLASGEKHSSILNKVSTMFRNIRYLYKMLGTADISAIGDGTIKGALNSLNTSFTVAVASKPYGGYPISDDSYVMRNKFGQVDIFLGVNVNVAPAVQNVWHTVAFVNSDYQPDNYRALNCLATNTETLERTTVSCFVYNQGNINVCISNLSDAQYVFEIRGSYFVNT